MNETASRHPYSVLDGRYRIDSFVGRGGMASVYRAHDQSLGRDVAVKLFEPAPANTEELARQQHELAVLASLNHPSLVTLHDAGIDRTDPANPRRFLVMELVEGKNLKEALSDGPMGRRQVAQLAYDLAEGLEYAHHHGVVHRDVKPANILLAEYTSHGVRTRAKLADFGIAQSRNGLPASGGLPPALPPTSARSRHAAKRSGRQAISIRSGSSSSSASAGRPRSPGPSFKRRWHASSTTPRFPTTFPWTGAFCSPV